MKPTYATGICEHCARHSAYLLSAFTIDGEMIRLCGVCRWDWQTPEFAERQQARRNHIDGGLWHHDHSH